MGMRLSSELKSIRLRDSKNLQRRRDATNHALRRLAGKLTDLSEKLRKMTVQTGQRLHKGEEKVQKFKREASTSVHRLKSQNARLAKELKHVNVIKAKEKCYC